jgi:hypothetical protein
MHGKEGKQMLAENIQKNRFIRKIPSQKEEHKQSIRYKSGVEYVDGTDLA